jgi:hypothetical protein
MGGSASVRVMNPSCSQFEKTRQICAPMRKYVVVFGKKVGRICSNIWRYRATSESGERKVSEKKIMRHHLSNIFGVHRRGIGSRALA